MSGNAIKDFNDSSNSMPWDEVDHYKMIAQSPTRMDIPDHATLEKDMSEEWRRIGQARRKLLLEEDRKKGGTNFNLNKSCNIDRYFQVAHRALEQFHKMYRDGGGLEDTYIMGHRMLSFLTECLPSHPGFRKKGVIELRRKSRRQLEILKQRLEDLALRIDEEQCNRFADDFDPVVFADDSDSDSEEISNAQSQGWVSFGSWKDEERGTRSPTTDTVATTGTDSVDGYDLSSSDESTPERRIDFSDYEDTSPERIHSIKLGTEFLEKVAREAVLYETDSDAADSWAQGQDADSNAPSASSGRGTTCDPARIAFRDLMSRIPNSNLLATPPSSSKLLSPMKGKEFDRPMSSYKVDHRRPDPPAFIASRGSREDPVDPEGLSYSARPQHTPTVVKDSEIESEVQRYLNSSFDDDPNSVFDSIERLQNSNSTGADDMQNKVSEKEKSDSLQPRNISQSQKYTRSTDRQRALEKFKSTGKENDASDAIDTRAWVSFDGGTVSPKFSTVGWNR